MAASTRITFESKTLPSQITLASFMHVSGPNCAKKWLNRLRLVVQPIHSYIGNASDEYKEDNHP
jgi:hypothetical protein